MTGDEAAVAAYRAAYERWRRDLDELHAVLLDGKALDPLRRIALIRRESHTKERYEEARAHLLGLPGTGDENDPFGEQ